MSLSHYEVLGVSSRATQEEIRLAYLHRARENHPDRAAPGDTQVRMERERKMVAVNAAWFVLRDGDRRRLYDFELAEAAARRPWEVEEPDEWIPSTERPFDISSESPVPTPEHGPAGNPAASIARLYTLVMFVVFILLGIAFAYAVVRSGSVGLELPE